jgi:hypothetical protein
MLTLLCKQALSTRFLTETPRITFLRSNFRMRQLENLDSE